MITDKHISLLLEYFIQHDIKEYFINEEYKDFYCTYLTLNKKNKSLLEECYGAKVHSIFTSKDNNHFPVISIRGHITHNETLYTFLAKIDSDIEVYVVYEVKDIIKSICNINLPKEELDILKLRV